MTLTAAEQLAIKEKLIDWMEQHFPIEQDGRAADQTARKMTAVELINAELNRWCEDKDLPIQTLASLSRETPEALPTAGRDRNGGRCDILIAWLNFDSKPGSSLDCLPPIPDTIAPLSPREIVLRETYQYLKENPLANTLLNRRCKRIIRQAIDNQDLTIEEAFTLKMSVHHTEEAKQKTRNALIELENKCPNFHRLCVLDTLSTRLSHKLERLQRRPSQPNPHLAPPALVDALSFMNHWRRTPQSQCQDSLRGCFGEWDTIMEKDEPCGFQP